MSYNIHSNAYEFLNRVILVMPRKCRLCKIEKKDDLFYKTRNGCKPCLNKIRRDRFKPSICRHCKISYRPDVRGRYKFCNEKCRFLAKITIDQSGCWIWNAAITEGYGSFVFDNKRNGLAHRASHKIFKGDLDRKLLVLHSCHKPVCVNPEHLRQGTNADNARDKVLAGRQGRTLKKNKELLCL